MALRMEIVAEVAARLASVPRGSRAALAAGEADRLGVSTATLYRAMRRLRPAQARRRNRADKGQPRGVDLAAVQAVALVKAKCRDHVNGRELPTQAAIAVAEERGLIAAGAVCASAVDRWARARSLVAPARVYCRFQAVRANDLHQVDSTGSKYLRVLGRERVEGPGHVPDWRIGVRAPEYRRKRADEPLGLWCTAVLDDHSRVTHAEYVVAAGESHQVVIDALSHAWSGDPRCPLRGMPARLLCDYGPFKKSQEGRHFCESVGVELVASMPKSPWTQGKVENQWKPFISFEMAFLADPAAEMSLCDLNARLASFLAGRNARRHPLFLDRACEQVYNASLDPAKVHTLPEDVAAAIFREDWRRARSDATIQYRNAWYQVPDELAGRWVQVIRAADGAMAVVSDGRSFPVKEMAPIEAGQYRAHADTPAMRLEKEAAAAVFPAVANTENRTPTTLRLRLGRPAEIASPLAGVAQEEQYINADAARRAFVERVGVPLCQWPIEMQSILAEALRATLSKKVLEEAALEFRALLGKAV